MDDALLHENTQVNGQHIGVKVTIKTEIYTFTDRSSVNAPSRRKVRANQSLVCLKQSTQRVLQSLNFFFSCFYLQE